MYSNYLPYLLLSGILLALIALLFVSFILLYLWYKHKQHLTKGFDNGSNLVFFKISVPEDNEVEIKSMEQFYTNLLGLKDTGRFNVNNSPHISLEIVGTNSGIDFYIVCNKETETLVEKAIHAVYADAEVLKGKENCWNIWEKPGHQEFAEYYLSKEDYYPIQTYEELELDSLNSITSVLSKMSEGEALAVQILIRPSIDTWKDVGNSMASYLTNKKDKEGNPTSTDKDREKSEIIKNKTKKEGFETVIRTFSVAPTQELAKANLKNLKNAISVLDNPVGNKISKKPVKSIPFLLNGEQEFLIAFVWRIFPYFHLEIPFLKKILFKGYSVLNTKELATLYHFPNKNVKTPGINWLRAKSHIAPSELPEKGLYLGISSFRGVERPVYMYDDDRRRHTYILGQTGTGKSELMKFLAIQDIKNGKGIAFMDPHGSAVKDILTQIPPERINDVIYFNPGDEHFPMGLNLLDVKTTRARDLVINSFIELLYKLYDPNRQGIVGPQLERAVRNAMLTIMDAVPGGTMVEVMRLVIDEKYQKQLIPKVTDPIVKRYWTDEMANTQAFHKSEKTGYFVSKFDRFVTDKIMRNIIGQSKSAFDFNEVMKEKKILLIDLNKGVLGEESSKFLGLLLVPRILAAAFSRANLEDSANFDDFYLYVDEFQNFSTPDFVTILSEARKYKLNLIVANQFLGQMTDDIKNAIFGNVGTLASFRVGQDDAKYMSEQFAPYFTETDLISMKVGNAILRLLVNGHPTPPFSLKTDWVEMTNATRSNEIANQVIENTRKNYAKPATEVEKEIDERSGLSKTDDPISPFSSPFSSPSPFSSAPRPSGFGAPMGSGGFSNPFPSPFNKDPDKPFSSGKTPFSSGNANSPFSPPSGQPSFGLNRHNLSSANRFPPGGVNSPFNNTFGSNPRNERFPNPFGAETKDAKNPDDPRNLKGVNPWDNPRPFSATEGNNNNSPKRGAISLSDLDSGQKKDYIQTSNTFNNAGGTPPPRPTFKPKTIAGSENLPQPEDNHHPRSHPKL